MHVKLHTTLQIKTPQGVINKLDLNLPSGATIAEVLTDLNIARPEGDLIFVINHKSCDLSTILLDGQTLDVIPAISGGASSQYIKKRVFY